MTGHTDTPAMPDAPASKTPPVAPARRLRRRSRWTAARLFVGAAFTLAVAIGAGLLIGLALSQEPPAWWSSVDGASPAVVEAALRVENGAATQLTKIRAESSPSPDGSMPVPKPWTIALKASDANAWLAARLRPWLESQDGAPFRWPEELRQVQVEFRGGSILIGASVSPAGGATTGDGRASQVLAAALTPEFRDDGSLWMPARRVGLGRLSLPASWMLSPGAGGAATLTGAAVPENLARMPEAKDVLAALTGRIAVMQTPIVRIGDGRRVRLIDLQARDGVLLITCETLARETSRAEK